MTPGDARRLLAEPLEWRVAGFQGVDSYPAESPWQCRLSLSGPGGLEQSVVILRPDGRDIPYLDPADNARAYRIDRVDFQNWLAAARAIGARIEEAKNSPEASAEPSEEEPAPQLPDASVPDEPEEEPSAEPEEPEEPVVDAPEPDAGDSPEPAESMPEETPDAIPDSEE